MAGRAPAIPKIAKSKPVPREEQIRQGDNDLQRGSQGGSELDETKTGITFEAERDLLPLEERIRQRAYEIYLTRGSLDGSDVDDWLRAEAQILAAKDASGSSHGI